jgi:hypothetical protein
LEKLGILPNSVAQRRRHLFREGIPGDKVSELPVPRNGAAEAVAALGEWLAARPRDRVMVFCPRFSVRRLAYLAEALLSEEMRDRVVWIPLRARRYDETNWWRSREGVLDVFDAYVRFAHVRWFGLAGRSGREWDPDAYERGLP